MCYSNNSIHTWCRILYIFQHVTQMFKQISELGNLGNYLLFILFCYLQTQNDINKVPLTLTIKHLQHTSYKNMLYFRLLNPVLWIRINMMPIRIRNHGSASGKMDQDQDLRIRIENNGSRSSSWWTISASCISPVMFSLDSVFSKKL